MHLKAKVHLQKLNESLTWNHLPHAVWVRSPPGTTLDFFMLRRYPPTLPAHASINESWKMPYDLNSAKTQ